MRHHLSRPRLLAAAFAAACTLPMALSPARAQPEVHAHDHAARPARAPAAAPQPEAQGLHNVPEAAEPCPGKDMPKLAFVFEDAPSALAAHAAAVRAVADRYGASTCIRSFDRLAAGVDPDANARFLLGALGLQQYAVVVLLTPRHADALAKVARQFPATTYLQLHGRVAADNLIPYRPRGADPARQEALWPRKGWVQFYGDVAQCATAGKRIRAPAAGAAAKTRGSAAPAAAALCPAA